MFHTPNHTHPLEKLEPLSRRETLQLLSSTAFSLLLPWIAARPVSAATEAPPLPGGSLKTSTPPDVPVMFDVDRPRELSPLYRFALRYNGPKWYYAADIYFHLRDDQFHHGFSDRELRGLTKRQLYNLHNAHHGGLIARGQSGPELPPLANEPSDAMAFRYRGGGFLLDGYHADALADYAAALDREPRNADVLSTIGWFFATCPHNHYRQGQRAVQFAQQACEITEFKVWSQINTLAAACAEVGDFRAAQSYQEQALSIAPEWQTAGCQERLQWYHARLTYVEARRRQTEAATVQYTAQTY